MSTDSREKVDVSQQWTESMVGISRKLKLPNADRIVGIVNRIPRETCSLPAGFPRSKDEKSFGI